MYDEDRDALAAEYVLGTLSADERDQAEALLVIDPGFAEIVRVWERRLGELNVMVEAVEPPPDVWDRIKTEIDGAEQRIAAEAKVGSPAAEPGPLPTITGTVPQTVPDRAAEAAPEIAPEASPQSEQAEQPLANVAEPPSETTPDLLAEFARDGDAAPEQDLDETLSVAALASSLLPPEPEAKAAVPAPARPAATASAPKSERSADVIYLARQVRRWRGFTVAMSAVAALLAAYVAVGQFAPGLLPANRSPRTVAASPPPGQRLVAVLQQEPTAPAFLLTVDPQRRTMTVRRMTASADSGRSYQLWLIPSKDSKPHSLGLVGAGEFTTRPLPSDFDAGELRTASYAVSLEPAGGSPNDLPSGPVLFTGKMVESVPAPPPSPKT
jgi:anti-sigma-K factor RskA